MSALISKKLYTGQVNSIALEKDFEHTLGDKEQVLWVMVLKTTDNLADFASRYHRLATETRADNGKAVRRLKLVVQKCAPALASQIDFDLLNLGNEVSLDKVIECAKRPSRIQAIDKQTQGSSPSTRKAAKEVEPTEVRYIDRPCFLPGHETHPLHECKTLKLKHNRPNRPHIIKGPSKVSMEEAEGAEVSVSPCKPSRQRIMGAVIWRGS